jgi:hypothetical protein
MMASGQGYLELNVLGSSPIEENNFNFLNEKIILLSLLLSDPILKDIHVFSSAHVNINIENFVIQKSQFAKTLLILHKEAKFWV